MPITSSRAGSKEGGSVIAELTLVIPMLTFLILSITDYGMFLQSYFQICHIARSGVRTAGVIPNLSQAAINTGNYVVSTDTAGVISYSPAILTPEHSFIHNRLLTLLNAGNGTAAKHSFQLENNKVVISTKCKNNGGNGADTVEVRVSARYQPITPFNSMLSVMNFNPVTFDFSTVSEGSYLFSNCAP